MFAFIELYHPFLSQFWHADVHVIFVFIHVFALIHHNFVSLTQCVKFYCFFFTNTHIVHAIAMPCHCPQLCCSVWTDELLTHGHQSIAFIAYTSGTKLSVSCFWEQNLEVGQSYRLRHSLNFWTLLLVFNEYVTRQFKMCCCGEKCTFSNFNTDFRIRYVSWQNN